MPLYQARVSELAAIVAAVEGSGIVHDRCRNMINWGHFIQHFTEGRVVNGWQVYRKSGGTDQERWVETYQLDKIRAVHDETASELLFNSNIDAVALEFINGRDLTFGHVADGFQIIGFEPRMFGSVLCHVAECAITVSMYTTDL